jgi:hypothetical protein
LHTKNTLQLAGNSVANKALPRTAMQIKKTKPMIKQTALIFLRKCSLQQCYLIELLRTTNLKQPARLWRGTTKPINLYNPNAKMRSG